MSLIEEATNLYAKALVEQNSELSRALAPFVMIKAVVSHIYTDPFQFGPLLEPALLRSSYTKEEVRSLFNDSILQHSPQYVAFLEKLGTHVVDDNSRIELFLQYAYKGFHGAALNTLNIIQDRQRLMGEVNDKLMRFQHVMKVKFALPYIVGEPQSWNRDTMCLLDRLGLRISDDFEHQLYSDKEPWSKIRTDAQVNWVGDCAQAIGDGLPIASMASGDLRFSQGIHLVNAFLTEANSLHGGERPDGWNALNFPRFFPVLMDEVSADELISRNCGVVEIVPVVELEDGSAHHGFKALNADTKPSDIALATSLLHYDYLYQLLMRSEGKILLVPYDIIAIQSDEIDEQMLTAMGSHRPELVRMLSSGEIRRGLFDENALGIELYLRGIALGKHGFGVDVNFGRGLFKSSILDLLKTEQERATLRSVVISPKDEYRVENTPAMVFRQDGIESTKAVDELIRQVDIATQYFGSKPYYLIEGSLDFFENLSRRDVAIPIFKALTESGDSFCGEYGISKHYRLGARLGACPKKLVKFGSTPSELIIKANRTSDKDDIERIIGMLERMPLIDVVMAAKTDKQIEFVNTHFDVTPVLDEIPKRVEHKFLRHKLSSDLGM